MFNAMQMATFCPTHSNATHQAMGNRDKFSQRVKVNPSPCNAAACRLLAAKAPIVATHGPSWRYRNKKPFDATKFANPIICHGVPIYVLENMDR